MPSSLPAWVLPWAAPNRLANNKARGKIDIPYSDGGLVCTDEGTAVEGRQAIRKRRGVGRHAVGLEPLLTVGETAMILNVSERTVRRLIASKALPVVLIGRSVRLRPRDLGRLVADGGVCND